MRSLNPILQSAMDSGNFTPIVRAAVLDPDDHTVQQYLDLVYYKINGLDIEIEFYDPSGTFSDSVSLERGALIGGVEYTIFSGIYRLSSSFKVKGGKHGLYSATGSLVDPSAVNVAADVSYQAVINAVLDLGSNSATFKTPGAAWLGYQFLADGQFFHTSNIHTFFTLLKQKYLIYTAENGLIASPPGNSILFFSVADTLALASQYTLHLSDRDTFSIGNNYRQFIWKDEAGTTHQPGPALYPIHNLGYLESTDSPPSVPDNNLPAGEIVMTVIPNLKYQTGDCVSFDPGIDGYSPVKSVLDVTEIFDTRGRIGLGSSPSWRMDLRPLGYFSSTEGGAIASAAQYTTTYAPFTTSGFSGLLDSHVTNLQALADGVDKIPAARLDVENVFIDINSFSKTFMDETGDYYQLVYSNLILSNTIPSSGWFDAMKFSTVINSPSTQFIVSGIHGDVSMEAGSSVLMSAILVTTGVNSGHADMVTGLNIGMWGGGGTITDYKAITFAAESATTVTNAYGIQLGDIAFGTTLNYAILTGAGLVSFGDQVGIGTSTPGGMLHIVNASADQIGFLVQAASGQSESIFECKDSLENMLFKVQANGVLLPVQATTAGKPAYVKGGMYFDTTLKKLRIGGTSAWETVTSV